MDAQRWKRIDELFQRALDVPAEERDTFLLESCAGDDALRAEVQALLGADARTTGFLRPPSPRTLGSVVDRPLPGPGIGARVGAWTLVERIGSGAMGTVWRARRTDREYEQTAAVKLLPPGACSRESLERFRRERQTLARLNHPHIARILDGGTTGEGVPFFAMEYVDGVPIDRYCDESRLTVAERLRLFVRVCEAVHHAHQNLVVHRDLKPSNILVDRSGSPRLLDFGIVKMLEEADEEDSPRLTSTGERLMTPHYASPEQVRGEPVSTATDVYSLGVVVYELLTGLLPHATGSGVRELEDAILNRDPERPSAAAVRTAPAGREPSHGPADPDTKAARRRTDAPRLRRTLAGDLDTIVLTALRKEPERRYGSAEQLAEDLRRHLSGRPVAARPDTWRYRSAKFVRRHRLGVAATASVMAALVIAVVALARAAQVASGHLAEVLRLSDLTRLADYTAEAEELWPARPEKVEAMEHWIARARELARGLTHHREALTALRARALPYDEEARRRDRLANPGAPRLDALRVQRTSTLHRIAAAPPDLAELESRLVTIDEEIARLEDAASVRRSWRFATVEDQWQHDKLAELVSGLEALLEPETGLLARVERRSEEARSLQRRSIEEPAEAWRAAIASIGDPDECPAYEGLRIEPQLGLVPLWRNPASGMWEFTVAGTGERPAIDGDGRVRVAEESALVLVLVPGGSFRMGSEPDLDPAARADETPAHEATLDPFFLSKFEMTQGQWLRFTGENPSVYEAGETHGDVTIDLRHPVEQVSWHESERVLWRMGLCLPTEAQWEYAARGGTRTPWWTGASRDSLAGAVNLADSAARRAGVPWPALRDWPELDDGHVVHAPVDAFRPNPWGFHNMNGNVWEWCDDEYARYDLPVREGTGQRLWKGASDRIGRGGSFMDAAVSARSAHRGHGAAAAREPSIGVRPARPLE